MLGRAVAVAPRAASRHKDFQQKLETHMPTQYVAYGGSLAREAAGRAPRSARWKHEVLHSSLSGYSPRVLAEYSILPQPPPVYTVPPQQLETAKVRRKAPLRQRPPANPSVLQRARQRAAGQTQRPPVASDHDSPQPWWAETEIAWRSPEVHAEMQPQPPAGREGPSPRRAHATAPHTLHATCAAQNSAEWIGRSDVTRSFVPLEPLQ